MRNERIYCTLKPHSNYTYCHEEMKIKTRVHIRQASPQQMPFLRHCGMGCRLVCAPPWASCPSTCINPHSSEVHTTVVPILQWGNWGWGKQGNLSKATRVFSGTASVENLVKFNARSVLLTRYPPMPGSGLSTLYAKYNLILTKTMWNRYWCSFYR